MVETSIRLRYRISRRLHAVFVLVSLALRRLFRNTAQGLDILPRRSAIATVLRTELWDDVLLDHSSRVDCVGSTLGLAVEGTLDS